MRVGILGGGQLARMIALAGHPLQHPDAQRQPGVDARRSAPDVPGADQQPVAGHLGVGGILAQRPGE